MATCLRHAQTYGMGEWCAYCGDPRERHGARAVQSGEIAYNPESHGLELHLPAPVPPLTAEEIRDGAALTMLKCPDCTTTYPADARHMCNMRSVELPEIKDEDIPPHERL